METKEAGRRLIRSASSVGNVRFVNGLTAVPSDVVNFSLPISKGEKFTLKLRRIKMKNYQLQIFADNQNDRRLFLRFAASAIIAVMVSAMAHTAFALAKFEPPDGKTMVIIGQDRDEINFYREAVSK